LDCDALTIEIQIHVSLHAKKQSAKTRFMKSPCLAVLLLVSLSHVIAQELHCPQQTKIESGGKFPVAQTLYYVIAADAPSVASGAIAVTVEKFYRQKYTSADVPTHSVSLVRRRGFRWCSSTYYSDVSRQTYRAYNDEHISNYQLRHRFHAYFNSIARTDEPQSLVRPRYNFLSGDGDVCDQSVYLLHYEHAPGKQTFVDFDVPVLASHTKMHIRVLDFGDGDQEPEQYDWDFQR
jgi:hypothetical protein